jgi:hypothetical protein
MVRLHPHACLALVAVATLIACNELPSASAASSDLRMVAAGTGLSVRTLQDLSRGAELYLAGEPGANALRVRGLTGFMAEKGFGNRLPPAPRGQCGAAVHWQLIKTLQPYASVPAVNAILRAQVTRTGRNPCSNCCLTSGNECLYYLQGGGCSSNAC